jgi:quercetin dioxygenase-like cupin family protein
MSESYYVALDATQQIEMLPGVRRRTMATTERMMLCEFTVSKDGDGVPPHSHPHDQCGYVLSGKIEFTVGVVTRVCLPGDTYGIPGGVIHSAKPLEDTVLVEVFAPPREEYR